MENLKISPIPEQIKEYINKFDTTPADISFIPWEENGKLFAPIHSIPFFEYLQCRCPDNKIIILGNSEDILFTEFHGLIYDIGFYLLTSIFVPIFVSLTTDYIKQEFFSSKDPVEIHYSLIIDKNNQKIQYNFSGTPDEAIKTLQIIKEMNDGK